MAAIYLFALSLSRAQIMDQAMNVGAPVIGLNDSGGARIQVLFCGCPVLPVSLYLFELLTSHLSSFAKKNPSHFFLYPSTDRYPVFRRRA